MLNMANPKVRKAIYERDLGLCGFCDMPVDEHAMHLDHIFPFALGGRTTWENLRLAHPACNIAAGRRVSLALHPTPVRRGAGVRLPDDIYTRLNEIAEREDRSLNAQIVRALREWLADDPTVE